MPARDFRKTETLALVVRGKDGHAKSSRAAAPDAKEYDEYEEEHTEPFAEAATTFTLAATK